MPPEASFRLKLPSILVIVPLEELPFTITLAPIIGSPLASTTCPFTVTDCSIVWTSFASANTDCGLPANKAEAITVENRILFGVIFSKSFIIILKF